MAKALQQELAEPFFHLSLDELRGGYPRQWWQQDHGGVLFRRLPPLDEPVHAHGCYDLEVDTSVQGPAEVAKLIVAALADPPVVSAFDRLRTANEFPRA